MTAQTFTRSSDVQQRRDMQKKLTKRLRQSRNGNKHKKLQNKNDQGVAAGFCSVVVAYLISLHVFSSTLYTYIELMADKHIYSA